ncbi:MAG: hypothetical protein K5852_02570 [Eubacterium sp.]|nr:hypothetical protein [Eubacterium sp.]
MTNISTMDQWNRMNDPIILNSLDELKELLKIIPEGTMIRLELEVDDGDPDDPGTISVVRG